MLQKKHNTIFCQNNSSVITRNLETHKKISKLLHYFIIAVLYKAHNFVSLLSCLIGCKDGIFKFISNLHVQGYKFGRKLDQFGEEKKSFAELVELAFCNCGLSGPANT